MQRCCTDKHNNVQDAQSMASAAQFEHARDTLRSSIVLRGFMKTTVLPGIVGFLLVPAICQATETVCYPYLDSHASKFYQIYAQCCAAAGGTAESRLYENGTSVCCTFPSEEPREAVRGINSLWTCLRNRAFTLQPDLKQSCDKDVSEETQSSGAEPDDLEYAQK